MYITPETVDDYIKLLRDKTYFTQANYGDGEMSCIIGEPGKNAQGEDYIRPLQQDLIRTIKEPRFTWFGFNPGKKIQGKVFNWFAYTFPENRFPFTFKPVWKEILVEANVKGNFGGFIKAIRERKVVYVGPKHLIGIKPIVNYVDFIEVPLPNAYLAVNNTVNKVRESIAKHNPDIILWSSGMATNVAMWRLIPSFPKLSMLDCGALFDPYVGVTSRGAYRKPEHKIAIEKTLKEAGLWT